MQNRVSAYQERFQDASSEAAIHSLFWRCIKWSNNSYLEYAQVKYLSSLCKSKQVIRIMLWSFSIFGFEYLQEINVRHNSMNHMNQVFFPFTLSSICFTSFQLSELNPSENPIRGFFMSNKPASASRPMQFTEGLRSSDIYRKYIASTSNPQGPPNIYKKYICLQLCNL